MKVKDRFQRAAVILLGEGSQKIRVAEKGSSADLLQPTCFLTSQWRTDVLDFKVEFSVLYHKALKAACSSHKSACVLVGVFVCV